MSLVFILNKRRQEQDATAYILSDVRTQILTHWIGAQMTISGGTLSEQSRLGT